MISVETYICIYMQRKRHGSNPMKHNSNRFWEKEVWQRGFKLYAA